VRVSVVNTSSPLLAVWQRFERLGSMISGRSDLQRREAAKRQVQSLATPGPLISVSA
jgi:hypothetical protein